MKKEVVERLARLREVVSVTSFDAFQQMEPEVRSLYAATALAGEVGEACDLVKKRARGDQIEDFGQKLLKEAGDILWYLERLLQDNGLTTADAFDALVQKLHERGHLPAEE